MKDIQENIDKLMRKHNIKNQTELLMKIADKLNKNRYEFNKSQKANFSKMLKGQRPMNDAYIIPLEEILHASFAEIVNGDIYNLPEDEKLKPYLKGIRYYAYKDDPKLYEELLKEIDDDGRPIICNFDEYEYTFIDYLIKYKSKNGIKFLVDKYKFNYSNITGFFIQSDVGTPIYHRISDLDLAIEILNFDNVSLFEKIFDPFKDISGFGYLTKSSVYKQDLFNERILSNDHIFKSLFIVKKLNLSDANKGINIKGNTETGLFVNPIINLILDYALHHLDKHKDKAKIIINFGLDANAEIAKELNNDFCTDYEGHVRRCGVYEILGASVISRYKVTGDKEIDKLIAKLNKGARYAENF